jgi:YfiH family protein
MQQLLIDQQQHWQFNVFNAWPSVKHIVTGRNPHIHRGNIAGLNYGLNVPDDPLAVAQNRTEIAQLLHASDAAVVIPFQTHSNNIAVIDDSNKDHIFENTDALITNVPGIIIGTLSADCVPILLADPVAHVIASIHAGWKGTVSEIAKHTVQRMQKDFNCLPENILAGIGPSISAVCYEVGEEVAIHFSDSCKSDSSNGKTCIDLWKANQAQLIEAGLLPEHIEIAGRCTFSNPADFYSARRDGIQTGRMGSFILFN